MHMGLTCNVHVIDMCVCSSAAGPVQPLIQAELPAEDPSNFTLTTTSLERLGQFAYLCMLLPVVFVGASKSNPLPICSTSHLAVDTTVADHLPLLIEQDCTSNLIISFPSCTLQPAFSNLAEPEKATPSEFTMVLITP